MDTPPKVVGQLSDLAQQEVEEEIVVRPWDDDPEDEEEFIKLPMFDLGGGAGDESAV
jgi:hypothetical protein